MKKILKKIDKINITTSQSEYKLIKRNVIWDDSEQDFYDSNNDREFSQTKNIFIRAGS